MNELAEERNSGLEDMDKVVNEMFKQPEFKWNVLNPKLTNYSMTLKFVPAMIDEMTNLDNSKITQSQLLRLRYFAQNIIDYRTSNLLTDYRQAHIIIDMWKRINNHLNENFLNFTLNLIDLQPHHQLWIYIVIDIRKESASYFLNC